MKMAGSDIKLKCRPYVLLRKLNASDLNYSRKSEVVSQKKRSKGRKRQRKSLHGAEPVSNTEEDKSVLADGADGTLLRYVMNTICFMSS